MGNGQSQDEEEQVGYRVLGVQANSPGSVGGFVTFFDFIVAANGVPLRNMDTTFVDIIKASEDNQLILTVYNCKSHTIRETVVTPTRKWPGEGLLGVIIRFDTFYDAAEHMCHVLDVEINSPAELAGLQPMTDYLLGTVDVVFKNTDILFDVLRVNIDKPVEFYVYNSSTDEVRLCVLMPSQDWGGEGILGASVACGYLHSLPAASCQTIGMSYEGTTKGVVVGDFQSPFGHYNNVDQDSIPKIEHSTESNAAEQNCDTLVMAKIDSIDNIKVKFVNDTVPINSTIIPTIQNHSIVAVHNSAAETNSDIASRVSEFQANKISTQLEKFDRKPDPVKELSPSKGITTFDTVLSFFDGNPPAD